MSSAVLLLALLFCTAQSRYVKDLNATNFWILSTRAVRGFALCPCSRSARGYASSVLRDVSWDLSVLSVDSGQNRMQVGLDLVSLCRSRYGWEACVNADAALRSDAIAPLCSYDAVTGKGLSIDQNGTGFITNGWCSTDRRSVSPFKFLGRGTSSSTVASSATIRNATSQGESPSQGGSVQYPAGAGPDTSNSARPPAAGGTTGNIRLTRDPAEMRFSNSSARVRNRPLFCVCSPSSNGVARVVRDFVSSILPRAGADRKEAKALIARSMLLYGYEAFVNADALLRAHNASLCTYDNETKKNLYFVGDVVYTLAPCDRTKVTKSAPAYLDSSSGTGSSSAPPGASSAGAQPADSTISEDTSVTIPKASTGPDPRNSSFGNEGCVAIEHLKGYTLQHRNHLFRSVLCGKGFCATPNHAIIVDGAMTSMKQLCSHGGWKCVRQAKWVNNLKLSANRRAKVSKSIEVTPYDIITKFVA